MHQNSYTRMWLRFSLAVAVLAMFAAPAVAIEAVAPKGVGDHLIFAYWSTDGHDTHVSITSPLGVRNTGETHNVIAVAIYDQGAEALATFKICLMPGDTWTAGLMASDEQSVLQVVDPGECDDAVNQDAGTRRETPVPTPTVDDRVMLAGSSGYLTAAVAPTDGLVDNTLPCSTVDTNTKSGKCPVGHATTPTAGTSAPDVDSDPEDATARPIMGTAAVVSPMSGYASGYRAVALTGCEDADSTTTTDPQEHECTPAEMTAALRTGLLVGDWTAFYEEGVINTSTNVIVTFPGTQHLVYEGKTAATDGDDVAGTDPVSLLVFDRTGYLAGESQEVMWDAAVNSCQFTAREGMSANVSCNGESVAMIGADSGSFRFVNNEAPHISATDDVVTGDGEESDALDQAAQAPAVSSDTGGQESGNGSFGAVGLVFSYWIGGNGRQYDQVGPLQGYDVTEAALADDPL